MKLSTKILSSVAFVGLLLPVVADRDLGPGVDLGRPRVHLDGRTRVRDDDAVVVAADEDEQ